MPKRVLKNSIRSRVPVPDEFDEMTGLDDLDERRPVVTIPFELPSGHVVECMSEEERNVCRDTAKPYLEVGANIPDEAWLHIKSYLDLVLLKERTLAQTRHPEFLDLDIKSQKEVRQSVVSLTGEINNFAQRLDPLKAARGDDGVTPAEWRADIQAKALIYAREHLGEFTWQARCPEPTCRYNDEPFFMLMEQPHFAFDPAAGPGVVWNEECAELVHRHYCQKAGCEHVAHRKSYVSSLSVGDAARILRVSPIGLLMLAWERNKYDLGFPEEIDPDQPDTLKKYLK